MRVVTGQRIESPAVAGIPRADHDVRDRDDRDGEEWRLADD